MNLAYVHRELWCTSVAESVRREQRPDQQGLRCRFERKEEERVSYSKEKAKTFNEPERISPM